jgi:hypothetical protein
VRHASGLQLFGTEHMQEVFLAIARQTLVGVNGAEQLAPPGPLAASLLLQCCLCVFCQGLRPMDQTCVASLAFPCSTALLRTSRIPICRLCPSAVLCCAKFRDFLRIYLELGSCLLVGGRHGAPGSLHLSMQALGNFPVFYASSAWLPR